MKKSAGAVVAVAVLALIASAAWGAVRHFQAKPREFDPVKTRLVQGTWVAGIGCPTSIKTATVNPSGKIVPGDPYTDDACATAPTDHRVRGLLLAKTGPTSNVASAVARISGVKGLTLSELGYDIRKPDAAADPRGSHCGAGAPRFNIRTADGTLYFLGCNSPPGEAITGTGWLRLRWGAGGLMAFSTQTGVFEDISGMTVKSISLVFDEGQDTGPDNFGMAVLDNIDVNGRLIGRGGVSAS